MSHAPDPAHGRRTGRCPVRRVLRGDDGRLSAFVAVVFPALIVLAGLALDGGLALSAGIRANGHAEAAARAGAQGLDLAAARQGQIRLDPHRAGTLARDALARAGATGTVTATTSSVTVAVSDTHATQLLVAIGIRSLPVHATATAAPQRVLPAA